MKKLIIILGITAVVAGGCNRTAKPQDISAVKQEKNNYMNEKWNFEINDSTEGLITVSHTFDNNGKYVFSKFETHHCYNETANGTYYYQPETNEIFIHIEESSAGSSVMDILIRKDYKQYIKIVEFSDTQAIVLPWGIDWNGVDWKISENGKYKLIEPQNVETIERRTYQRFKEELLDQF